MSNENRCPFSFSGGMCAYHDHGIDGELKTTEECEPGYWMMLKVCQQAMNQETARQEGEKERPGGFLQEEDELGKTCRNWQKGGYYSEQCSRVCHTCTKNIKLCYETDQRSPDTPDRRGPQPELTVNGMLTDRRKSRGRRGGY